MVVLCNTFSPKVTSFRNFPKSAVWSYYVIYSASKVTFDLKADFWLSTVCRRAGQQCKKFSKVSCMIVLCNKFRSKVTSFRNSPNSAVWSYYVIHSRNTFSCNIFTEHMQQRGDFWAEQVRDGSCRSVLPHSVEKSQMRLKLEIKTTWHSECNRLYYHYSSLTHTHTHTHTHRHPPPIDRR